MQHPMEYPFLTRDEFHQAARYFVDKATSIGEPWQLVVETTPYTTRVHLELEQKRPISRSVPTEQEAEVIDADLNDDDDGDDAFDVATIQSSNINANLEWITWRYHIDYSPSYRLPVLYFHGWYADGTAVDLNDLPVNNQTSEPNPLQSNLRQGYITQSSHSINGLSAYQLHPCGSADLLRTVAGSTSIPLCHYIASWLSLVGASVDLNVSSDYIQGDTQ
ncbi:hypothetical protein BDF22DRAFT_438228 [Syncephalis plumigaleata]|nr:hypothetical protein BDF22DRAFT_438228 [Syncephalis plumigaleata]